MPAELSLESLGKDLIEIKTLVAGIKVGMHETEEDKEASKKAAKKAMDEEHEKEKMEAKKASRTAAMKKAMEEPIDEKRDAAMRKAMDEDHKEHDAMMNDHDKHKDHSAMHDEKDHKAMDEKKEKDAQIASIIQDKKNSIIAKILTANTIMNPTAVKAVEKRLKEASIVDVEKEWNILKPAFEGSVAQTTQPEKVIPFYANITADIDENQLNASSPDSDFAKLSTKELLEVSQ